MAAPGRFYGLAYGVSRFSNETQIASQSTFNIATLNNGYCIRFKATRTDDIKTVYLHFPAAGSAQITVRIETIDATSGLPSGTLYDANATKANTVSATGWNAFTFATLPTAGLTVGNEYAIVALNTSASGATTITFQGGSTRCAFYPHITLTATDGTTRTNFAEVANSAGVCTLVYEDDSEEPQLFPWTTSATANNIFGTNAFGSKIILPATTVIRGFDQYIARTGTPAGDLVIKVWNSSDTVVLTHTLDKDSIVGFNAKQSLIEVPTTTLAAGTYRIMCESQGSANSSNCYTTRYFTARTSALLSSGRIFTSSTNIDGSPPTWSDNADRYASGGFWLDDEMVSGSGGGPLIGPGRLLRN